VCNNSRVRRVQGRGQFDGMSLSYQPPTWKGAMQREQQPNLQSIIARAPLLLHLRATVCTTTPSCAQRSLMLPIRQQLPLLYPRPNQNPAPCRPTPTSCAALRPCPLGQCSHTHAALRHCTIHPHTTLHQQSSARCASARCASARSPSVMQFLSPAGQSLHRKKALRKQSGGGAAAGGCVSKGTTCGGSRQSEEYITVM
jgi:hypothetical protein